MMIFELLFWTAAVVVAYAYLAYPALVWMASQFFEREVKRARIEPSVSILISAHNEEAVIAAKLRNLLALNYPAERIEILIGLDGCTDGTRKAIAPFEGSGIEVRVLEFSEQKGKPAVLNDLAKSAKNEILVFTDVRQLFDQNAVRVLAEDFGDPEVGSVSGELFFLETESGHVGKGMDAYWRYEKFLRKNESKLHSMLGATGAIYAVRRELFGGVPEDVLVDDMYIPLSIVLKGYRAVFESEAQAFDRVSERGGQEFTRKVRTLCGNFQLLQKMPALIHLKKSPVALQFISHKLLRLIVPYCLAVLIWTSFELRYEPFYGWMLFLQTLFYGTALWGWAADRKDSARRSTLRRLAAVPYLFCVLNWAAVMGLVRFVTRRHRAAWEKAYK